MSLMVMPRYVALDICEALTKLESNFTLHYADLCEVTMQVMDSFLICNHLNPLPHQHIEYSRLPILSGSSEIFKESTFLQKLQLAYKIYREDIRRVLCSIGLDGAISVENGFNYGYYKLDMTSSKLILQHFDF